MSRVDMLQFLGLFSLVAFVGSLIAVPWLIGRMRADYFVTHRQEVEERHRRHPALAALIWFLRNGFGLCLVIAGIVMLVLPGQGLLTILIGICLMDFSGKRRLIERLAGDSHIQRALNWMRRRRGRPEFVFAGKSMQEDGRR